MFLFFVEVAQVVLEVGQPTVAAVCPKKHETICKYQNQHDNKVTVYKLAFPWIPMNLTANNFSIHPVQAGH